jgi:hypothetical protein
MNLVAAVASMSHFHWFRRARGLESLRWHRVVPRVALALRWLDKWQKPGVRNYIYALAILPLCRSPEIKPPCLSLLTVN